MSNYRIAFSTLACPEWPLGEIVRRAREYGYDGIELRGLLNEIDVTRRPEFAPASLAATRRMFEEEGLKVCCLGSSVRLLHTAGPEASKRDEEEFARYLELSAGLGGVPIRIFGGHLPEGLDRERALAQATESLERLAEAARAVQTLVLVESHDGFCSGRDLGALLRRCDAPNVGALWDVFNSQMPGSESVEETYSELRSFVRHIHVKDGDPGQERPLYTPLGEGKIPYSDVLRLLRADDYSGWLSVEWEKRWHPELLDPELVLPQYARRLRQLVPDSGPTEERSGA
ncbi:MAG: sugar phosphate isomerase/epimerase [candidate division KSB1 bacterium]|nr:sugar phosphate isomerase/epimerase [candidate division KSB1 bacterium]